MSTMSSISTQAALPPGAGAPQEEELSEGKKKAIIIGSIIGLVIVLALAVVAAVYLVNNPERASAFRDVFIIFMALEFMLIGAALVVLIVQIAVLTNMLQHEIKPILESTNETVNTVRGTSVFLSENLVEPVIKLNSYVAALSSAVDTLRSFGGFGRRK